MKKIFLNSTFFILSLILFFSCKDEERDVTPSQQFTISSSLNSSIENTKNIEISVSSSVIQDEDIVLIFNISAKSTASLNTDYLLSETIENQTVRLIIESGNSLAILNVDFLEDFIQEEAESIILELDQSSIPTGAEVNITKIELTIEDNTLTNGLIARYLFNGNANDSGPLELNASFVNASLSTDRFNTAGSSYDFDGIHDYIEIPNNEQFNFDSTDDFSISLWVNIESGIPAGEIIGKWNALSSSGYPFTIRYIDQTAAIEAKRNKLAALRYDSQVCANNPLLISNDLNFGNWINFTLTKQGTTLKVFQNGTLIESIDDTTTSSCGTTNSSAVLLGVRNYNQRFFNGKIDDIFFYSRAITESEIVCLYELN